MVEVEEIELDLGLSIGGTFRKPVEETKPDSRPESFHSNLQRVDPPQVKREAQALRRMEARKKREQKRGDRVGESGPEPEPEPESLRASKKGKTTGFLDGVTVSWTTTPFRVQQQQQQGYATLQYVPLNNGLALPCWVASEKNMGGVDGVNGGDGRAKSNNGSSRCSSSVVSDYQCSSREDGGSTDSHSHSHSANSLAEPTQPNSSKETANIIRNQPEERDSSSPPVRSQQYGNNGQDGKQTVKRTQSNVTQPEPLKLREESAENKKALPVPSVKPLCNENSSSGKERKDDQMGKPPKPLTQTTSLPQMPYVSTKGNGPNGRTVNGFLYRYSSQSEVSIVCVCHGSTFSPAEFVQHAGGTDISHPLKHITVIPSAFG